MRHHFTGSASLALFLAAIQLQPCWIGFLCVLFFFILYSIGGFLFVSIFFGPKTTSTFCSSWANSQSIYCDTDTKWISAFLFSFENLSTIWAKQKIVSHSTIWCVCVWRFSWKASERTNRSIQNHWLKIMHLWSRFGYCVWEKEVTILTESTAQPHQNIRSSFEFAFVFFSNTIFLFIRCFLLFCFVLMAIADQQREYKLFSGILHFAALLYGWPGKRYTHTNDIKMLFTTFVRLFDLAFF